MPKGQRQICTTSNLEILTLYDTTKLDQILPGVMQLESKRASVGRTSPLSRAFFILSSASLADLDTQP